jgi:hypothetical protein
LKNTIINIGDKFGSWLVLSKSGKNIRNRQLWLCRCECGNEREVVQNNLICNTSKSCGCRGKSKLIKQNKERINKTTPLSVLKQVISGYNGDAKRRGYIFKLTEEECLGLFKQNCHYCGDGPSNIKSYFKDKNIKAQYMGIDRIDNTKGYYINNVVPCCRKCNRAKDIMSYDDFKNHITKIYNNMRKQ